MMPLPGFQNPTPYLAPAVAKNSYTSLFKSYAKKKKSKIQCIFKYLEPKYLKYHRCVLSWKSPTVFILQQNHIPPVEKNVKCVMALPFRQYFEGKLNISYTHFYIQIFNTLARFKSSVPPIWASIK